MRDTEFDINACLARIRSVDPLTFEDAYGELAPRAAQYVPELIRHLQASEDSYTRGKFVELLGDARDPAALPALAAELGHPDPQIRRWAVGSLTLIGGQEAARLVAEHQTRHPDDVEPFSG